MHFIRQLFTFGYLQALACIFPAAIFIILAISTVIDIPFIHRYDFILIMCVLVQIFMVSSKLETIDELKVITIFHIIGYALEVYKVHMGSWSYPEEGWTKILGVPLYSGFMYASVASYICQAWRRLNLEITHWPKAFLTIAISFGIYFNFFTHHYIYDFRWVLSVALFIIFIKTMVSYKLNGITYRMPLNLSFILIGFFIWIAENITTFFGAWTYPNQEEGWKIVHIGKISSWFLLVVISLIIVAQLKHVKQGMMKEHTKSQSY